MIEIFNRDAQVFPLACPLLVPLVENGRFSKDDIVVTTILKEYIDQLTVHDVDTIVLGCTHYPLLMDAIKMRLISRQSERSEDASFSVRYSDNCNSRSQYSVSAVSFKEM